MKTALIATLALLALPSVSSADNPQPPPFPNDAPIVSTAVTRASVRIAIKFWGANPCKTSMPRVRLAVLSSTGETPTGMAPSERYWADHPCDAVLSPAFAARFSKIPHWYDYQDEIYECGLVVHWVGHALGRDHSDATNSIMNAAPSATVRLCYSRFKPRKVSIKRDRSLFERIWATA